VKPYFLNLQYLVYLAGKYFGLFSLFDLFLLVKFLGQKIVDHTSTKANSPQTNAICERFHRTMKDECYNIIFRKKIYSTIIELQSDIDNWLKSYNETRPHSGKYCYGKTPYQTFLDSKKIAKEKNLSNLFDNKDSNLDNKVSNEIN